jgi:ABC-type multidrug transport system fused ATPase/permease subunit
MYGDSRRTPVLQGDEPLSHVDRESEVVVATALELMRPRHTCLAVTHRPSLFPHADVVYRLDDGHIYALLAERP